MNVRALVNSYFSFPDSASSSHNEAEPLKMHSRAEHGKDKKQLVRVSVG